MNANDKNSSIKANNNLTNNINKLFMLTENYPKLQANDHFMQLQNQLKETEDKIAYSRIEYNKAVLNYKNTIETIPTNILASIFEFKSETFYDIDEKIYENVTIDL